MTTPGDGTAEVEVLRAEDPRCRELEDRGYTLVSESWGARLRLGEPPDTTRLAALVHRATSAGVSVEELGPEHAHALHRLELATHADYPVGPATMQPARSLDDVRELWASGRRVFGALDSGRLLGATVVERDGPYVETLFTSVLAAHRSRGLGSAVKAASVAALAADGVRLFGSGGAGVNEISIAMNRSVGYTVEERWLSYRRP